LEQGGKELEAAVRSIISRNDSFPFLNSLPFPSSLSSFNTDPGAHLADDASSDKNINRMLTNLMAEVNGGGVSLLPIFIIVDDTAIRRFLWTLMMTEIW